MAKEFELTPTNGLVGGETVQFAEAYARDQIGVGVAMAEDAFDLVEPHLSAAASDWTPAHRYGVFLVSPEARKAMAVSMRRHASDLGATPQRDLLESLASWLEARLDQQKAIYFLGI